MFYNTVCVAMVTAFAIFISISGYHNNGSNLYGSSFWLEETPSDDVIETALWNFDWYDFDWSEMLISVSPSGNYMLMADRGEIDINRRLMYGANALGWQTQHLSLYERQGGSYVLIARIYIDPETDPELNDTVASSDETGVAWNGDETLILISGGTVRTRGHFNFGASNIYLVDFSQQSVERLTDNTFMGREHGHVKVTLPQWSEEHGATFIRSEWADDGINVSLMNINVETGRQEILADLSCSEGAAFVLDYAIHGGYVYYSNSHLRIESAGLFRANLDGGQSRPIQLLSILDIIDYYDIGFSGAGFNEFFSVEISQDGRWICLTARNMRFLTRDIPLADCPDFPHPDPSSAVSFMTGMEWIPFHTVFLYDLKNNELISPFADKLLRPDVVIVTAATFSPDGKTLLCAVFGSGGEWTMDSFNEVTLYQIRLDDGSFDTMRIFRTDLDFHTPDQLLWLGNNTLSMRPLGGTPPSFHVQIVKPAVFERFNR